MLQRAVAFADLGADYLDRVDKYRTAKRLIRRLDALGYAVMLHPKGSSGNIRIRWHVITSFVDSRCLKGLLCRLDD